jgi:hypothetical protein
MGQSLSRAVLSMTSALAFVSDVRFIGNRTKSHLNVVMELTGVAVIIPQGSSHSCAELSCLESAQRQGFDVMDHTADGDQVPRGKTTLTADGSCSSPLLLAVAVARPVSSPTAGLDR